MLTESILLYFAFVSDVSAATQSAVHAFYTKKLKAKEIIITFNNQRSHRRISWLPGVTMTAYLPSAPSLSALLGGGALAGVIGASGQVSVQQLGHHTSGLSLIPAEWGHPATVSVGRSG